jgi:hypothetical protein
MQMLVPAGHGGLNVAARILAMRREYLNTGMACCRTTVSFTNPGDDSVDECWAVSDRH